MGFDSWLVKVVLNYSSTFFSIEIWVNGDGDYYHRVRVSATAKCKANSWLRAL
jgi:hypothetical protein